MRRFGDHPETSGMSWQVLSSLWPYLLAFKRRVFWASVCLILAKVASIYLPFLLKYLVDALDAASPEATTQQVNAWLLGPLALVFAYGMARFLNVVFNELRDTLFGRVTEGTMRSVGLATFKHLHRLELDFHLNRRTGAVSRDMERGISAINSLMRFMVFNIIPTLVEVLIVVVLLFINYGLSFALTIFLSVVFYIGFSVYATEWRTRFVRKANMADSKSNARAIDSLLNYETVKYFTNERYEAARYDGALAEWQEAKRQNRLSLFALNGGQALIVAIGTTTMLAIAALGVQRGELTIGDFVLLNAFMMQIFIPLNFLGFVYREIKGSLASIEGLFDLLKQPVRIDDAPDAPALQVDQGAIHFEMVDFAYQPDRQILSQIDLHIAAGETVALVGASGSGKSTMVKLLFRFYDPVTGRILIDGQDIKTVRQESLRAALGIVPQDTVLFNDTLRENIRYGRPEASDDEVYQAACLAHLEEFIQQLPDGMDTHVGERGLKLSGGEKQRVAIARTILKNPKILVFDEATSSLDSRSELAILSAIKSMSSGRTTLVIAHRLSTIVDADRIIVMHAGRIVEQGAHQPLLDAKGAYYDLWQAQQHEASEITAE
ncbi:MAG: ABC transporter ATP-binding protein/permease [Oleiphilaceae bacterium]|nr:ABC transporter ATP-binding protein/permease [Oleiphilaceae bacterium]